MKFNIYSQKYERPSPKSLGKFMELTEPSLLRQYLKDTENSPVNATIHVMIELEEPDDLLALQRIKEKLPDKVAPSYRLLKSEDVMPDGVAYQTIFENRRAELNGKYVRHALLTLRFERNAVTEGDITKLLGLPAGSIQAEEHHA